MKQGIQGYKKWVPVMALLFFGFAQSGCAQNNYPNSDPNNGAYSNNDNNGNYDNSDEALIAPDQDVDYNTFHDELSPYGNWMNYPGYGNVWVCNVAGFQPYNTGGHWAYTRFGWTWVSDYNWGWAPFHYGRWSFDNAYGWFWVPGYTWGPAWVSWRTGGDYYGWAPLGPGLSVGFNVGIGIPAASWVFLPHRYMGFRNMNNYYVNHTQNVNIIHNTTIINNTNVVNNNRYVVGPDRREVERYSGQRVQPQNIYVSNQRNATGEDRNGIHMYHPQVNNNRAYNNVNRPNNQPTTAPQDNVRQQPFNRQPMQNGNTIQQPQMEQRQQQMQRNQPNGFNNNNENNPVQNNQPHTQDLQNNRPQQQPNFDQQRQQQMEQQRQQMMNNRSEQIQQQQIDQRRQQMEAQRNQMMQQRDQQMQQQRQQDNQRQQMMQQRQQQSQQQQQQRQQQFQQRQMNNNSNRSYTPSSAPRGGGGNRQRN